MSIMAGLIAPLATNAGAMSSLAAGAGTASSILGTLGEVATVAGSANTISNIAKSSGEALQSASKVIPNVAEETVNTASKGFDFNKAVDNVKQSNQFTTVSTVDPLYPDTISDTHPSAQRFYALNKDTHFNYIRNNNAVNPPAKKGSLFGDFISKVMPDKLEKWFADNEDKIKDATKFGLEKTVGGQLERRFNSLFEPMPVQEANSKSYEEGGGGQPMQQREFNMYDSFYSQVGGIKK